MEELTSQHRTINHNEVFDAVELHDLGLADFSPMAIWLRKTVQDSCGRHDVDVELMQSAFPGVTLVFIGVLKQEASGRRRKASENPLFRVRSSSSDIKISRPKGAGGRRQVFIGADIGGRASRLGIDV